MKNLNLINPERRLGGHDFCGVNHANQTEVQTDNLSVSGRSEVSMTLDEQPCNHPVITPLSPRNHPLLPKQKSGKSLIRIGKNVAESHVRKYAGASRVWKYAAMVVLMVTLGVGNAWATDYSGQGSNAGFNKDGGVKVTFDINGTSTEKTLNRGGMGNIDLGTITTSLTLTKIQTIYWKNNSGNICGGTAFVKSPGDSDFGENALEWHDSNIYKEFSWNYMGKDPGTYYITAYFKMTGNAGGSSNCPDNFWYSNYKDNDWTTNAQNYTFKFVIPSKNLTVAGAANGNSVSGNQTGIKTGYTYTITATPTTGYTFGGWSATSGSSSITIANSSSASTNVTFNDYSNNVTVTANFTPKNYTVTLHDNNGAEHNGTATATYNSTTLTSISAPTRTGYYVTGYYAEVGCTTKVAEADGTLVAGVTGFTDASGKWIATEDKTLYAKWDNHYTVTFEQGSPTFQGTGEVEATYGAALPAISVPSKTGYIFGGYYTGENGTGTQYYNENGVGLINWAEAANTTLHAKWTGIRYQVAFDANEGSGTMTNQDFTYGAAATALTTNTYTRTGYYFLGWNTNADGSGTAFYNGKAVQNLTSVDGGIVTLYAQWAKTYTLYFLNMGVGDWQNASGDQASTIRYAYAFISYDGHEMYPLGGWTNNTAQGTRMTATESIRLSNVSGGTNTWCWSIAGVPEGATIVFSDNTSTKKTRDLNNWTKEKTYYCKGNDTWYALDATNTISKMTEMSVHLVVLTGDKSPYSEAGAYDYGIDKHGDELYAIAELPAGRYKYKYYNWYADKWSGYGSDNVYIMDMTNNYGYNSGEMNGSDGGQNVYFYTTVSSGEYKFKLEWVGAEGKTPKTTLYYPVGVTLGALDVTQALAGESTTVTLTATPAKTYLMTNPTYYYQMSTDGGTNWTTIATSNSNTYAYTFAARSCKFRVMLQNDAGLRSKSNEQSFTAYSTKSFYVYNPYNDNTNKWRYLHLYTWDSNNGNTTYNGSWPGGYIHGVDNATDDGCANGNTLEYKGDNWFKITIDERANCFMLVGEETYSDHQTVTCYTNGYIEGGKYMIYTENKQNKVVEYQAKGASDLRLKYTDGSGKELYSDIYNTTLDGTSVIASLWMNASASSPTLVIQRGSGNNTWSDAVTYSGTGFTNLIPDTKEDHGYVFQMDLNLSTPAVSNVTEYTGPFYVRTDGLEGGWNAYKNNSKNTMYANTATSPAYDYYLCKWIGSAGTNVKFTVANDYNKELVASLGHDDILGEEDEETLPAAANVRFAWNSQTNTLSRAYISGSTNASDRFLVMTEKASDAGYTTGKIYNESGTALTSAEGGQVDGLNEHELLFADNGNWVYQLVMFANPGAYTKVTAKFGTHTQEFIPMGELIGGSGSSKQKYRIVYDFKTNILTTAWVPNGPVNADISLNANVMLIRNGQNAAEELTFGDKGGGEHYSITNAQKLISVMQFDYNNMVGKMNSWNSQAYQYCMYYISFPFNVDVNKIFGIGTYGTDWKLQYYDGAERASKGFFRGDGTTTFWKDVPADGTLKKYVGYSLLLNRVKFNNGSSDIWENKGTGSSVYLYFPSNEDAGTLQHNNYVLEVPYHECTLPNSWTDESGTHEHRITDSHWNMIGVPILANSTVDGGLESILGAEGDFRYLYAWNYGDNSLSVADAEESFTFQAMKAYMVQYHGPITFTGAGIQTPSSVAARKTAEKKNYSINLQVLNADEQEINHTYVKMQEGADADFALNEDLCMVTNNRAVNIYTFAGSYDVAANVLPVENTTIPVGLTVKTAGSYTIAMPSNFSGTATLVDTYAQTRTNLALEDYTVQLEKGTVNDRFFLEIGINNAPTAIDGVTDGTGSLKDGKTHKFIENGAMYILRDGVIYDARGNKVK